MVKRCLKCGSKKRPSRHHIFGKKGLCGLPYDSKTHLTILLTWIGVAWDELDIVFWENKIIYLCRKCHDEFHIFLTKLLKECDDLESQEPILSYLRNRKPEVYQCQFQEDQDGIPLTT